MARSFPAVVVSGARQVGKSTLLKQVFGHQAEMVVFDPVQDIGNARQDPEGFGQRRRTRLDLPNPPFELVWRGALPDAVSLPTEAIADFWSAYFRTYVERDVRLLTEVSDWHTFGRFVRIAAALTAQEVNASHLGRELGITPQTARRWLDLLVATF